MKTLHKRHRIPPRGMMKTLHKRHRIPRGEKIDRAVGQVCKKSDVSRWKRPRGHLDDSERRGGTGILRGANERISVKKAGQKSAEGKTSRKMREGARHTCLRCVSTLLMNVKERNGFSCFSGFSSK